jgi:hypothetical protein
MRIRCLLPFLAGLAAGSVSASTSTPAFTVVDLATEYAAFYDATPTLEAGARVEAFKAHFAPRFPGFYAAGRIGAFTVHSMGEMDGGIRTIGGRRFLVFGADVMARLHQPGEAQPFFHHELFHVYHRQPFQGCDVVWCALWAEGLAVYVSERLNPGATDAQLMLEVPRPIRPEVDAKRREVVCAVNARLDSGARNDYAPLFMGRASLDGLPPRFAYYVGYQVAREASRTRSLQDLAHLPPADARPVVDAALATLADCKSPDDSRIGGRW